MVMTQLLRHGIGETEERGHVIINQNICISPRDFNLARFEPRGGAAAAWRVGVL